MSPLLLSLLFTLLVSLVSLVSLPLIFSKVKKLTFFSFLLVSFAVGNLLGDAFIHLLPEAFEALPHPQASLLTLLGILLYFILEKILRFRHCHDPDCKDTHQDSPSHIVPLSQLGDSLHNFFDGILIAASFSISPHLGISTALAILFHEIPQEIGDFAILIHHKVSIKKAFLLNALSALASLFGVLIFFLFTSSIESLSFYILPLTAGAFIYLASSDLIPELHRHDSKLSQSLLQLFFLVLGIFLMYSLSFLE